MTESTQPQATEMPKEVEIIQPDAIVDIKMSAGYYNRVIGVAGSFVNGKSQEQMNAAHEQIKSRNVTEEWVNHYETVLILCKEFEKNAKDAGLTKMVPLEEAIKMMEGPQDESATN
jgi:hypothetical protein